MKISDVDESVNLMDFENFLDVYEDGRLENAPYAYNLNSTVYFGDVPYKEREVKHTMFWTTISYEIYKSTRLWWILMKLNDVDESNIFSPVYAGQTVKYLDESDVRRIISQNLHS